MTERNVRQRLNPNDAIQLAQAAILQNPTHRGQVTNRDRAILQRGVALSPNLVQRPLQFDRFRATRFDYRLHFNSTDQFVDLTAIMQSRDEQEKFALDGFMTHFFAQLLSQVRNFRDPAGTIPQPNDHDIVHLYLDNAGVGFTFSMDYAGRDRMTLGGLLQPNSVELSKMVENFAVIIQSGQHVILNNNTVFRIWLFAPPVGGGRHVKSLDKDHLMKVMKSVKKCPLEAPWCMPGSILLALDTDREHRKYTNVNDSKRPRYKKALLAAAIQLCIDADVDSNVDAMGPYELWKFSSFLHINIHYFDITDGNAECSKQINDRSQPLENAPHIYLVLDHTHFNAISNADTFLRTMLNVKRVLCDTCQTIFSTRALKAAHTCAHHYSAPNDEPPKLWHDPITGLSSKYKPFEGTKMEEDFVKPTKTKADSIKGILYLDFETFPVPVIDTPEPMDEGVAEEKSFEPEDTPYIPCPFDSSYLQANSDYIQEVNWCEIQHEENGEVNTHTFTTLKDTFNFICQEKHKDFIVIAHCGGRFDFQFLYEHYLSSEVMRQGHQKEPLLKGQKITSATLIYNIRLVDSYSYVSKPLSALPAIFGVEDLAKGDFPHMFNQPKFQNYRGPIPALEWYDPETKSTKKRQELIEWHSEQVANKVIFDFNEEMRRYCHMDVTVLRVCMQKFRSMFQNLKTLDGQDIGCDPFQYITIAAVAFDGIYRRHFLEEKKIMVVPRPGNDMHSNMQIAWLNEVMRTQNIILNHALNGHRLGAGEMYVQIAEHFRDKQKLKSLKVDGFHWASNTVYEFQGCYYHGCPICFEPDQIVPQRKHVFTDKNTGKEKYADVRMGDLYQATKQKVERLRQNGFKVVEMWEHDWVRYCKKNKMNPKGDLPKLYLEPLIPREAYFGGRVNCTKMLYKCEGSELLYYMDVTSMYPFVMCAFDFPTGKPDVRTRTGVLPHEHNFLPIEELFGLQKCTVIPPKHLYHGVLPERDPVSAKITFPLTEMTGTWTSIELQVAVSVGYVVKEVYVQHHFTDKSKDLFKKYIDVFFDIKKKAAEDGNVGLKEVAKLMINAPTGKWGFNPEKQRRTKIVKDHAEFFKYLMGTYERCSMNIINNNAAIASIPDQDEYTPHVASNVYIAAFITGYARVKLYQDALEPLREKVVYMDTDSVVYVSPTGQPLINIDHTGQLGLWTNEGKDDDPFVEFVSSGPKSYGIRSRSGFNIIKSKGFYLNHANRQIFNFEALKEQVIARARHIPIRNLVLHKGETLMRRNYFRIEVKINSGKEMRMPYDKRVIEFPWHHSPRVIETYPLGHYKVPILDKTRDIALIIRTLVQAYGGNEGVESAICSFVFPLFCAFDNMYMNVARDVRISLVNDN